MLSLIKQMGQIAMDERVEVSIRVQVLKELCQYVAPKRKTVEVTGDKGGHWCLRSTGPNEGHHPLCSQAPTATTT